MALIQSTAIPSGATDYELEQSLKLDSASVANLQFTPSSASNRKTWTVSFWCKVNDIESGSQFILSGGNGCTDRIGVKFDSDMHLVVSVCGVGDMAETNAVFRDASAWYHFVVAIDTTKSVSNERIKFYVNGSYADKTDHNSLTHNKDYQINSTDLHSIGALSNDVTSSSYTFGGYLAEMHFIDGQQLTASDFGETGDYGEWKPIEYSGSYGTNGFYLPFKQDYTVEGFSTVTYKGTGQNGQYVGGAGFKPDLVWQKDRSSAYNHAIQDVIRGTGTNTHLASNTTSAEGEFPTYHNFQSFDNDGFTIGKTSNATNMQNHTGDNYVAWNWDMGADTPTGFGCVTYAGNGVARSIAGLGFQPDLVWFKEKNNAVSHRVFDSVRGATKRIFPNNDGAESTHTTALTSFDPDGFSVGDGGAVNGGSDTYVAWAWDMGNTTATNTSGSITSTVRANPTYGQSIVSYTGTGSNATIGHGLSSAPEMVITKRRDSTGDWDIWHTSIGDGTKYMVLTTQAVLTASNIWNSTVPSNTLVSLGTHASNNASSGTYIAYCFHSVTGYSKFGSWVGNANDTAPVITTGFRPAFVMYKKATGAADWVIVDNTRNPLGIKNKVLYPNSNAVEYSSPDAGQALIFTSTGFQPGGAGGDMNGNGETYIYMAFAGGMDSISDYNTDGSIDSRVKANPTYGQSIVSFNGTGANASVGHGLSSAPEFITVKNRDSATEWMTYTATTGNTDRLLLNQSGATAADVGAWNNTSPSASLFYLGSGTQTNAANDNYIAYCWHSVTGYSKIGSYTGNGSATGPTVTTGFKPAFVMIKRTNASGNDWIIHDSTRDPSNPNDAYLAANENNVEGSYTPIDFLNTGFQPKTTHAGMNDSGSTYIYMAFADTREYAYWLDQSGNNNDWTSNNLTESDISVDSPTNNFATLNPLSAKSNGWTYSEGNLKVVTGSANQITNSSFAVPTSGKWYCETLMTADGGGNPMVGVCEIGTTAGGTNPNVIYRHDGSIEESNSSTSGYATWTTGDIIGIAIDTTASNGTITFYKNNVSIVSSTGLNTRFSGADMMLINQSNGTDGHTQYWNFGQDSSFAGTKTAQGNQDGNDIGDFYYTPPTGFLALCTSNLPDVAVTPSEHFNTILYTGTGNTSTNAITGVGFQPDLVWTKNREDTYFHTLYDAVRGTGNTKAIHSNDTAAEGTHSAHNNLASFDTNGFTLGTTSSTSVQNYYDHSYVSWNWKANGSGSSNTAGSITSTVSANVDSGFSVSTWTGNATSGASVGHGLSKAPEMIINKCRSSAGNWAVYHAGNTSAPETEYLELETTAATADIENIWNDQAPTNSVFYLGNNAAVNGNGETFVTYCFHSVDGYSKCGSYTGNGNADGTFVYTGFRPAWVLIKRTNSTGHWKLFDSARSTFNLTNKYFNVNDSDAEATSAANALDFTSNGFKLRSDYGDTNVGTLIYIAFAETPFKNSNAR